MLAAAVLVHTSAVASSEPPLEAHLVAPGGAEVRTDPTQGPFHADHGGFLDGIGGLDVHRQGGVVGLVQRGGDRVLISAVRLRDEDEAGRALGAYANASREDAVIEILPEFAPDTVAHRITLEMPSGPTTMVEVSRATRSGPGGLRTARSERART